MSHMANIGQNAGIAVPLPIKNRFVKEQTAQEICIKASDNFFPLLNIEHSMYRTTSLDHEK